MDEYHLQRFISAQDAVWPSVINELKTEKKQTHWMWFVFPQLKGLGQSEIASYYGINSENEARAYLRNQKLAQRLNECVAILLDTETGDAKNIFGEIDAMKLHSSMTLFDFIQPADIYAEIIQKYFQAQPDYQTLRLLT